MTTETPQGPAEKAPADAAKGGFGSMSAVERAIYLSREGKATGETVVLSPEQARARRRRSAWTAIALFAFVILIFAVTIAKLGPENLQQ